MRTSPRLRFSATATAIAVVAAGCSLQSGESGASHVDVVVGYQSKTINTVTAGTLLRAKEFLEHRLSDIGSRTGTTYTVSWQDYDTGAPITAQMVAEKIDIGSMGDYPLLINGSRTQSNPRARTELISVTGYHPTGALNAVVVAPDSPAAALPDLRGQKISASVGSAGHGTLVQALQRAGIDPSTDVEVLNQQPQVGASALESGQAQALSQFVAWPQLLVFQDKARLLYDGAELGVPTFHGVVARRDYADRHPEVIEAFLAAQLDANDFLRDDPLEATRIVADQAGLPAEVVYLYNGPGGTSFDLTLKPELVAALQGDTEYLRSVGDFADLDLDAFVSDAPLREAFVERGLDYDAVRASLTNPLPVSGTDPVCGAAVTDPLSAGELWIGDPDRVTPSATPNCLLRAVRQAGARGQRVRAAYVADAALGTRLFADHAVWVRDGADYLPFGTPAGARRHLAGHPGSVQVDYPQAVAGAA